MAPAQHAARGASSAERWMNCPGSLALSQGLSNESSVYAREGSCAHAIAETCLSNGKDATAYKGEIVADFPEIDVDQEMCDAIQTYLDTVRGELEAYAAEGYDDVEFDVEIKFDLSHIYPDMFGTCDAAIYFPRWKKLSVFDYKHGYVSVPVERNKQTMYYGVGALTGKHNRAVDEIELIIVQPNALGAPVKRWTCDVNDMLDFISDLTAAAKETDNPFAAFKAGPWCKYCPAGRVPGRCSTIENLVLEIALAEFDVAGSIQPTPVENLNPAQLQLAWENADIAMSWAKNIKSYCRQQAVEGNPPPGTKLVKGKSWRAWSADAEDTLNTLVDMGDLTVDLYDSKLKSPSKLEKALGKEKGKIRHLWIEGEGALSLVPDTDPRAAVNITAEQEFTGVDTTVYCDDWRTPVTSMEKPTCSTIQRLNRT